MLDGPASKICRICEREKPRDDEHFHRDVSSVDGYKHDCKVCRREEDAYKREQKAEIIDDSFDRLRERGIQQLKRLSEGGSEVPHAAEVYQCIMGAFGGPRLFAQQLVACYFDPSTNQGVKAKLLQTIISMANKVSESGMIARDLETVPTEELQTMLQDRMEKAVQEKMRELRVHHPPALEGGTHERAVG